MTCVELRLDAWVFSKTPNRLSDAFVTAIGMPEVSPRRSIALEWGQALALSFAPPSSVVLDEPPDPNDIAWMALTAQVFQAVSSLADDFPDEMVWTVLRRRMNTDRPVPIFFFNLLLPEAVSSHFGRHVRTSSVVFVPPSSFGEVRSWDEIWSSEATVEALFLQQATREWWPSVVAHQRAWLLDACLPADGLASPKERL